MGFMDQEQDGYSEYAVRALEHYDLRVNSCRFIRHNENLVYRITEQTGRSNLLRIHWPRHAGFKGIQQDKAAIESELMWLKAIRRDTGIGVQEPIRNRHGEWVTRIAKSPGFEDLNCTLLTWIEAEPFTQNHPDAEALAFQIGALQSRMHAHSRKWQVPQNFRRLTYDEGLLAKALSDLKAGVASGLLAAGDFDMVCRAGDVILRLFHEVARDIQSWGLVHADFLSGNLLVKDGAIIPIDFSLSGFGYYLLDLAICLSNFKKHLRQPYLDGYGGVFSKEHRRMIESLIIYMILVSASKQMANPDWADWFARRFPIIAGDYCRRLEKREPFMMEI